ncbi:MAG: DUF3078 domain-containing protein [Cytophagaceae bacterium]|nr:DUF3078 domain-containing protein [Cytophagaceae bacterium]
MKKSAFAVLLTLLLGQLAIAQNPSPDTTRLLTLKDTSYWKRDAQFGATFNLSSFNGAWKDRTGALGANALLIALKANANYKRDRNEWTNALQIQYGLGRIEGQSTRKNIDVILFDTKYGRQLKNPKWNLFAGVNFLSQFAPGYIYTTNAQGAEIRSRISGLFSPAQFTESVGFEYKPVAYFSLQFGIGALRQTIVADDALLPLFPAQLGKNVRNQLGFQLLANFDRELVKNLNLKLRYQAFADYADLAAIANRLDAIVAAKIGRYFNVNLNTIILYDQALTPAGKSPATQVSFVSGIGFLYTF